MRKALLPGTLGLVAILSMAVSVPTSAPPLEQLALAATPPVDELAMANFPVVTVQDLVEGAQPKTNPIPHVSPEKFSNTVYVEGAVVTGSNARVDGPLYLDGGIILNGALFVDGGLTIGGTIAQKAAVGHLQQDGGRPALAIESGIVTLSGGTATFTFAEAFSYAPICVCNDTATTAAAADCSGASTTQVVPKGGTTATIAFICVGPR